MFSLLVLNHVMTEIYSTGMGVMWNVELRNYFTAQVCFTLLHLRLVSCKAMIQRRLEWFFTLSGEPSVCYHHDGDGICESLREPTVFRIAGFTHQTASTINGPAMSMSRLRCCQMIVQYLPFWVLQQFTM